MNLTRQSALSAALFVHTALADRVRAATGDAEYVDAVYGAWRDRLESLSSFRSDPALTDRTTKSVLGLMDAVLRTPSSDTDALYRWLDLFPSAVAELFPPSESTFTVQMEESTAETAEPMMDTEAGEFALVA